MEGRLALALDLGATCALEGGGTIVEQVKDLTGGGADYAIEATNGANLVAEACQCLGKLGVCAMVGGAKPTAEVSLNHPDMLQNGKRLMGVIGGGGYTPGFLVSLIEMQA